MSLKSFLITSLFLLCYFSISFVIHCFQGEIPFSFQAQKKGKPHLFFISLEDRRTGIISVCKFPELSCFSSSCGYKQRRKVYVHMHTHSSYCRHHCCGVLLKQAQIGAFYHAPGRCVLAWHTFPSSSRQPRYRMNRKKKLVCCLSHA